MTNASMQKWAWVLIYGGLLSASLGIFLTEQAPVPGWTVVVLGAGAAVAGVVLIVLRARRRD